MLTTQLNRLASWAKWSSVRWWTKLLWVRIPLLSLKLQTECLLHDRSSLTSRQTRECGFTLKLDHDMIFTPVHCLGKNSQHNLIIWPAWLNGWMFVYKLDGWGFESYCCHLSSGMGLASSKDFLDNQANYRVFIHSEARTWHDNIIKLNTLYW